MSWRESLARHLVQGASKRLRARHPAWAAAMLGEMDAVPEADRLRWAAGCLTASFKAPGAGDGVVYPAALAAGVAAVTVYQWSVDEGLRTLLLLTVIGLMLGLVRPGRAWLSGLVVGSVVAAVLGFERLTGLRPGYEDRIHTPLQCLSFMLLVGPTLAAAGAGALAGKFTERRF